MKKIVKIIIAVFVALFLVLCSSIEVQAADAPGTVKKTTYIYLKPDKNSEKLYKLQKNKKITVIRKSKDKKWYYIKVKVKDNGKEKTVKGYVLISKIKKKLTGEDITEYATKFVGNPYKWGGTSLTNGADCSGFVLGVYRKFGYDLPHSSGSQRTVGKKIKSLKDAKAGDIICYSGHVAIYLGGNKIVHASTPSTGIKISNNAKYKTIKSIRRIVQ